MWHRESKEDPLLKRLTKFISVTVWLRPTYRFPFLCKCHSALSLPSKSSPGPLSSPSTILQTHLINHKTIKVSTKHCSHSSQNPAQRRDEGQQSNPTGVYYCRPTTMERAATMVVTGTGQNQWIYSLIDTDQDWLGEYTAVEPSVEEGMFVLFARVWGDAVSRCTLRRGQTHTVSLSPSQATLPLPCDCPLPSSRCHRTNQMWGAAMCPLIRRRGGRPRSLCLIEIQPPLSRPWIIVAREVIFYGQQSRWTFYCRHFRLEVFWM